MARLLINKRAERGVDLGIMLVHQNCLLMRPRFGGTKRALLQELLAEVLGHWVAVVGNFLHLEANLLQEPSEYEVGACPIHINKVT